MSTDVAFGNFEEVVENKGGGDEERGRGMYVFTKGRYFMKTDNNFKTKGRVYHDEKTGINALDTGNFCYTQSGY